MSAQSKGISRRFSLRLLAAGIALLAAGCSAGVIEDVKQAVASAKESSAPTVSIFGITSLAVTNNAIVTFNLVCANASYYLVNESATAPAPNDPAWQGTKPVSQLLVGEGSHSLHAWAKSSGGAVSAAYAPITVTLDTTAPIVTTFALAAGSANPTATASIGLDLAASDATAGIAAWYISDSSTPPLAVDPGWKKPAQAASFTLSSGSGVKHLRAWVKDLAENVSAAAALLDITYLDQTHNPAISSFSLGSPAGAQAGYSNVVGIGMEITASLDAAFYLVKSGGSAPTASEPASAGSSSGWVAISPGTAVSATFALPASDGSYTLTAWGKNAVDQLSSAGVAKTVTLDTTRPS